MAAAALEAGWQRYKVAFQYIGTPYAGWQRNNPLARKASVQDVVEGAVHALVGKDNASPCQVGMNVWVCVGVFGGACSGVLRGIWVCGCRCGSGGVRLALIAPFDWKRHQLRGLSKRQFGPQSPNPLCP
jgi:hypothetical protein